MTRNRRIMLNTLAGIGFITLIGTSLWLAVYSTRFVPGVVNRIGSAAVYLGSVFVPSPEPILSVIPTPTASTTIPFATASSTSTTATSTQPVKKPVSTTAGTATNSVTPIGGTSATTALFGYPDLIVSITAVGYLATSSAESFVATTTVPAQSRPAVTFTIKNIGTNMSGSWRFNASIPTQTSYVYLSGPQQSLAPGDSIVYTLGFDQARRGVDQTISISVNPDRSITESNTNNNNASAKLTILGG
ncbi:MAG: CARDB domain-containing protein [Candidatus Pacebacteria bacterium]|nr:CARDB domain-containing protein [Candidatus Paceibacterota bacterium]